MTLGWIQASDRLVGKNGLYTDTLNRALRDFLIASGIDPDVATFHGIRGPVYNVKAFGAVGDNVHDDSAAFQAANDAAATAGGGTVVAPTGRYKTTATINWSSGVSFEGVYGGRVIPSYGTYVSGAAGTVVQWAGAINTPMFKSYNAHNQSFRNFTLDGASTAGVTGMLFDSNVASVPSNSATNNIEVKNFNIYQCPIGMQIGTDGATASEVDKLYVENFHIGCNVAGAKGIVINSGNGADDSLIAGGIISPCYVGVDIQIGGYTSIKRVSVGANGADAGSAAFKIVVASNIIVEQCESENAGTAPFIRVPASGFNSGNVVLSLIGNTVNNPISIEAPVRVLSAGNSSQTAPGTATCATNGALIHSAQDSFNGTGASWAISGGAKLTEFRGGNARIDAAVAINGATTITGATAVVGDLSVSSGNLKPRASLGTDVFALDTSGQTVVIANNGTQGLTATASFTGLVLITETSTTGASCVLLAGGGAVTIIAQTSADYSTVSGTAAKVNVYLSGSILTIENKQGGSRTFNTMLLRNRAA